MIQSAEETLSNPSCKQVRFVKSTSDEIVSEFGPIANFFRKKNKSVEYGYKRYEGKAAQGKELGLIVRYLNVDNKPMEVLVVNQ